MALAQILGIDEDVKLLSQDLIDVTLKARRCIGLSERHLLIFEMAILGAESRLPFVTFLDPDLIIGIGEVRMSEPPQLSAKLFKPLGLGVLASN